ARAEFYGPMAEAVLDYRKKGTGIFYSTDELGDVEGLSAATRNHLEDTVAVGAFSLLGAESVGPTVGADLQKKALLAIGFSLLGMLVYIWIRFQLPYAVGAVVALFHDVLITLTALAVTHREINLPTVAALLTLVGYSVNDTVVIFDRVRENLRLHRGEDLEKLMDLSINQTLSRTLITSGTTLIVVLSLFIFGGDVINTFAFVVLVGIVVGTYSSVFVASPAALGMNKLLVARRQRRRAKGRR
ncbi:MAG: protein translocase subunit SecF, partial [Thermoanaerobaculales bacterium]